MTTEFHRDPGDVKEFLAEALAYLDSSEPILAILQTESGDASKDVSTQIATIFRAFHSIKGVAGFLSFANIQELTHKAEGALDRVRTGKIIFDRNLGSTLLESCDLLRKFLQNISSHSDDLCFESEKNTMVTRLKTFSDVGTAPSISASSQSPITSSADALLYPWLIDETLLNKFSKGAIEELNGIEKNLIELLDHPNKLDLFKNSATIIEKLRINASALGFMHCLDICTTLSQSMSKTRHEGANFNPSEISIYFNACNVLKSLLESTTGSAVLIEQSKVSIKEIESLNALIDQTNSDLTQKNSNVNSPAPSSIPTAAAPTPNNTSSTKNEIRVSLERLDKMVDLIEELGVVSTGVYSVAEILDEDIGLRQTASKLRKITEELQEITVSIRMVPLSTVFRKMIRLVGDVSSKLGKKVRLEIVGEQTELDKDAVESLQDPLVHILRNCVDHGLEMPEDRLAAGKSETGVVKLQAWHSGGEAWISISDDGKGISCEKVFAKAVAQGLVASNASLTETEILAFIFHPGFSLAKEVTEFSGRGVGMDVVKKNIQSLKGRVDIESKLGSGSTFIIRLPMANALTESMLVRVGSVKYVIRVASIQETFQPSKSAITSLPNGDELVSLRGRLYPIIRLYQKHNIPDSETELDRGLIIIVENRGKQTGIFVDEVLGKIQAVIKPPPSILKSAKSLAGCSIIGTESDAIALALDINAIDQKLDEVVL